MIRTEEQRKGDNAACSTSPLPWSHRWKKPLNISGCMTRMARWIGCCVLFCCLSSVPAAGAAEKIVLQLPWHHQFQFAGYYAAIAQGYYQEAGLDVTVNSISPGLIPVDEVLAGRAQYGVGRSELLLHRLRGKPVVALATIFQHSAIIMLARQDSGINTPRDMVGRRVMLLAGDNSAEYTATFKSVGMTLGQLQVLPSSFAIQDLIDGKTDVFNAYITNEPFVLEEKKIPYTIIRPMDYGIDFYGDTLFTGESELAQHPDRVKAFRAASIRGWEYAIAHREEIIDLLIQKYKVDKTPSQLRYEANAMDKLILPQLVPIGQMLDKRWEKMAETYLQLGLVEPGYSLANFLYTPPSPPDYARLRTPIAVMATCFVAAFLVVLITLNRKLKRCVAERTEELEKSGKIFRAIYENIDNGLAIYEAQKDGDDFIIKDLNPAGCRFGQVQREEVLNRGVKEAFPGIEALGYLPVFKRVWQTGVAESMPTSYYQDERVALYVDTHVSRLPSGEILAVYCDRTEEMDAERKQRFFQKRLEALWHLSTMVNADLKEICNAILQEIVALSDSLYGFYGLLDGDETVLTVYAWSEQAMRDCGADHTFFHFPIADSGVWGNAVRERKPLLLNDYQQDAPHKKGTPAGHIALTRLLSVPLFVGDRIVAVAAVANKANDYLEEDVSHISAFLQSAQIVIDQKQHELVILAAKEEWQKSFDAIPDLIIIRDEKMRIVRANKAAYQFFDAQFGELNGKYCYDIFCGVSGPCPTCPLVNKTPNDRCESATITFDRLGRTFLVTSSTIDDEAGKAKYFVSVAKDITDQKRLEDEFFQAHKMEAIGTLAGGIAHDFNNLLSAMLGYAELIKQGSQPDSAIREDIEQVIAAGRRAGALVQQILDFSHKTSQHLQPVQPALIVHEALHLLRASLPSSIEIQEDIDPNCGAIQADPTKFYQVVMNLCTNAFQAMKEEKGVLRVTLARREKTGGETRKNGKAPISCIVLSVTDTGSGMSPETLAHIFDPFFSTKEVGKGTGLGLSVAHGIITGYQGSIEVQSSPGQGSTFRVYVPVLKQPELMSEHSETEAAISLFGTERILVVDDELLLVKASQRMLEDYGYTVTGTMDSKQALAMVQGDPRQFDLIITDQTMPGLTGVELARAVLEIVPSMPIILCTGHSAVTSAEEALALGIRKYLYKPLQVDELVRAVRVVLDERDKANG